MDSPIWVNHFLLQAQLDIVVNSTRSFTLELKSNQNNRTLKITHTENWSFIYLSSSCTRVPDTLPLLHFNHLFELLIFQTFLGHPLLLRLLEKAFCCTCYRHFNTSLDAIVLFPRARDVDYKYRNGLRVLRHHAVELPCLDTHNVTSLVVVLFEAWFST